MIFGYAKNDKDADVLTANYPEIVLIKEKELLFSSISGFTDNDVTVFLDIMDLYTDDDAFSDRNPDMLLESIIKLYQAIFASGSDIIIYNAPWFNSSLCRAAIVKNHVRDSSFVEMAVSEMLEAQIRAAIEERYKKKNKKTKTEGNASGKRPGNPKGSKYNSRKERISKEFILLHHFQFGGRLTNEEVISELGISRRTFFKYKKELLSDMEKRS